MSIDIHMTRGDTEISVDTPGNGGDTQVSVDTPGKGGDTQVSVDTYGAGETHNPGWNPMPAQMGGGTSGHSAFACEECAALRPQDLSPANLPPPCRGSAAYTQADPAPYLCVSSSWALSRGRCLPLSLLRSGCLYPGPRPSLCPPHLPSSGSVGSPGEGWGSGMGSGHFLALSQRGQYGQRKRSISRPCPPLLALCTLPAPAPALPPCKWGDIPHPSLSPPPECCLPPNCP